MEEEWDLKEIIEEYLADIWSTYGDKKETFSLVAALVNDVYCILTNTDQDIIEVHYKNPENTQGVKTSKTAEEIIQSKEETVNILLQGLEQTIKDLLVENKEVKDVASRAAEKANTYRKKAEYFEFNNIELKETIDDIFKKADPDNDSSDKEP